ncbi:2S seed storage protein-like [Rutidosis leptorrhynchoides]|uniref:2S seed storage protein-like n=1 Tax=Rutidosis leptorrhynchoides TaxID=125765 RepID=UPI003A98F6D4
MAKLALLALTFTVLIAFINVSARITTITISDNDVTDMQCSSQVKIEQLNSCKMHLTQGTHEMNLMMTVENQDVSYLQMCCRQLMNVDQECQCNAIQEVFDEVRKRRGVIVMRQILRKAQNLPNDCGLKVKDCPIIAPRI